MGNLLPEHEVVEGWAWRTGGSEFSPDLMVVAVADIDSDVRFTKVSLLSVEILSSNRANDYVTKMAKRAEAGLDHYWILDTDGILDVLVRGGCGSGGDLALSGQNRIVSRNVTRYSGVVIVSFRHKGLERFYRDGSSRGIQAGHVSKLSRILSALDVAQSPTDLAIPSFRTHPLKGDLAGHWSIWVNGNWRVTFRFVEADVELVDYRDYH